MTTWIVSSSESRPTPGLGADVHELGVPAPFGRLQAVLGHLGADPFGLGALLVDLVDRHDDRHFGRLGVVDRLLGLGLDAVVGGNHDHRQVGHARATGAHRGEGLVAGGVEEGDLLAAVVDLVGADVLGDAPGLAGDHLGLADRVQQRGLAVVDVAHDRDHRRAFDQLLLGVLEDRLELDVVGRVDDLDLLFELVREDLDRVVGQGLRERRHLSQRHQLLDHFGHRHAEVLGDVLDGRAGAHPDQVGGLHRGVVDRRDRVVVGAPPAAPAAGSPLGLVGGTALLAAGGLRVDHHAPAPAGADISGGALAGARVARRTHPLGGGRGGCAGGARRRLGCLGGRGRRGRGGALGGTCRVLGAAAWAGAGERDGAPDAGVGAAATGAAAGAPAGPLAAGAGRAAAGLAGAGALAAAGAGLDGALPGRSATAARAAAAPEPPLELSPSALRATASSTEDAAAFASTPAACSFSSSSLLERPCSFAISCTRFLLMLLLRFYEFGAGRHTRSQRPREASAAARKLQAGGLAPAGPEPEHR